MAKSRGRKFAELVAPANGIFAAASIPTIAISKLASSTFSVNSESASLGGNVVIDSNDVTEHTNALYFTNARADARITAASLLPLAGGTMTGNLTLGDNVNAYFGASTDLRIYHDGTNSHIINSTGELRITGSNIAIKSDSNKLYLGAGDDLKIYHTGTHSYIENGTGTLFVDAAQVNILDGANTAASFTAAGAVTLYNAGSQKLATTSTGVQTTGTVNVNGAYTLPTSDGSANQVLQTDGSGTLSFANAGSGSSVFSTSGSNAYYTSGSVGIGTNGPAFRLHAYHATTNVIARFESGDSNVWIDLHDSDSGTYGALLGHDSTNLFKIANASAENRLTLGNTGILLATGGFEIADSNTRISEGAANSVKIQTNNGYVDIGAMNGSYCHLQTDRANFYFNKRLTVDEGIVQSYDEDLQLRRAASSTDKLTIGSGHVSTPGYLRGSRLYAAADGGSGYFYNDTSTRTAYAGGDFYIQNSVANYYNYATNQYIGDASGDNIYFRANVLSGTGWNINGAGKFTTRDVQISAGYHIHRTDHHSGHLEGSYNNVAANGAKSNPIYTIGYDYNPADASLSNMYGIGYSNGSQSSFITGAGSPSGWGLYVAADGDSRIFLNGSEGKIHSASFCQSSAFYGHANVAGTGNATYHPSGIYSTGSNWLYGTIYTNGHGINFTGGAIASCSDIVCDNGYGQGLVGVYSATRYQHVWSMGAAYRTNSGGTSAGNMYGLTYTHTNIGTGTNQAISGLSHQLQHRTNGTLTAAIGAGIWTSGNVTAYSDIAVKTNLVKIPNALEKVCAINGYTYERTDYVKDPEDKNAPDILRQAGVVAQEVEKVLPEVVSGDEGNKAVAYGNIVSLLIEAIKEQQGQIEDLKHEIQALKEAK